MLAADVPARFPIPWGDAATPGTYIRAIPETSQIGIQNGAASLTDGFPPDCFIPVEAGGTPPFGQDTNGILNQITLWNQWQAAGGPVIYNASFSSSIGGYPHGALLTASTLNKYWVSTVDSNVTDPDAAGAGWSPLSNFLFGDGTSALPGMAFRDQLSTGFERSAGGEITAIGAAAALWVANVTGFGIGQAPAARAENTLFRTQNGMTAFFVGNANAGVGAIAAFRASNGTIDAAFGVTGPGYAEVPIPPSIAVLYSNAPAGIFIDARDGANPIYLGSNDTLMWKLLGTTGAWTPVTNNTYDIGTASLGVKNIFSNNAVTVISDERTKLKWVGDSADFGTPFLMALRPRMYTKKNDPTKQRHLGFYAQEVKQAADTAGLTRFAGWVLADPEDADSQQMLRLDELIAAIILGHQQHEHRLRKLGV